MAQSAPSPILPVSAGSPMRYRIALGDIRFECTAENSGRITTFAHQGRNVLTDAAVNPFNFGATFWTSPQRDWEWPPPAEIDSSAAFDGAIDGDTIVLSGPPCPALGVRVTKRFRADAEQNAIQLSYEMSNISDREVVYAPWEIARVKPGGLTFYPTGASELPPTIQSPLPVTDEGGVTWFHHTDQTVTGEHKRFADGKEGWIAHLHQDLLFVKTFKDTTPDMAAPGEAEIEVYAVPAYVEVEQQGAYSPLPPGQSLEWHVWWHLLPVSLDGSWVVDRAELVNIARGLAERCADPAPR